MTNSKDLAHQLIRTVLNQSRVFKGDLSDKAIDILYNQIRVDLHVYADTYQKEIEKDFAEVKKINWHFE